MAWHPTQPLVFTACADGIARCWDLRTGGMVRQFLGHASPVQVCGGGWRGAEEACADAGCWGLRTGGMVCQFLGHALLVQVSMWVYMWVCLCISVCVCVRVCMCVEGRNEEEV